MQKDEGLGTREKSQHRTKKQDPWLVNLIERAKGGFFLGGGGGNPPKKKKKKKKEAPPPPPPQQPVYI